MSAAVNMNAVRERVTLKIVYRNDLPHYEGSTPTLSQFDPRFIPWQLEAIKLVREWNYKDLGKLELMLSGALGSAKSVVLAHIVLTHCLMYPRARAVIARRTKPDLKATLYAKILEHIGDELEEGKDYVAYQNGNIRFANGSLIEARSWADRKGGKGARSLDLSLLAVEELTENDNEKDKDAIMELVSRVGRLAHVPESLFITATNPDEPSHWAYKYFISEPSPNRRTIYSVTTDNPFLLPWYREQLLRDMDPKMAERMIKGRWISILGTGVYHAYDAKLHEPTGEYTVNQQLPIVLSWDFNIGAGKPMSATFSQWDGRQKHFYAEVVIEGSRTQNILEEAWNRGLFEPRTTYLIRGDATGKANDTRQNLNDYLIMRAWLENKTRADGSRVMFRQEVPLSNPPVRSRHNVVNAWLLNDLGEVRVKVYSGCKVLREGFKLVKLKKGADYVEDDTPYYQHVTTAAGYDIHYENLMSRSSGTTVQQL